MASPMGCLLLTWMKQNSSRLLSEVLQLWLGLKIGRQLLFLLTMSSSTNTKISSPETAIFITKLHSHYTKEKKHLIASSKTQNWRGRYCDRGRYWWRRKDEFSRSGWCNWRPAFGWKRGGTQARKKMRPRSPWQRTGYKPQGGEE